MTNARLAGICHIPVIAIIGGLGAAVLWAVSTLTARLIGVVAVTMPLIAQRRFRVTRAALPLVLIAGTGEVFGSMLSAWGSRESIAITAVLGSQFAAIAAVAATA